MNMLFSNLLYVCFLTVSEPDNPKNVIVKKLELIVDGGPTMEIDLTCKSHLYFLDLLFVKGTSM